MFLRISIQKARCHISATRVFSKYVKSCLPDGRAHNFSRSLPDMYSKQLILPIVLGPKPTDGLIARAAITIFSCLRALMSLGSSTSTQGLEREGSHKGKSAALAGHMVSFSQLLSTSEVLNGIAALVHYASLAIAKELFDQRKIYGV